MSRVAVVGLGLIGGSAALAFRAAGWDRRESARSDAAARGLDVASSLEEAVADCEFVIAAVPASETAALLPRLARLAPRAILTDVASRKRAVVDAASGLPAGARFVAGHPMAGAAASGISSARADLFAGRPWFLVATARSDEPSIASLAALVREIGAVPRVVDADRHDEAMTWVSHLPFGVAAALARAVRREVGADVGAWAGPGLFDMTRLAGTPATLARELAFANPARLASALDAVSEELSGLAEALRNGDASPLEELLDDAARARREIAPES